MVFDLGRGLRRIDNQQFFDWENQIAPCAYPRQNHAWFCISFWQSGENTAPTTKTETYIWYIKLPLDENGLLIQASRNQFLEIVITALGAELQHTHNENAQLPENPFIFEPSQQQLADCNAHIRKALNHTSRDYSKVSHYMQAPSVQDWQGLSVQDIADYVCASEGKDDCKIQATLAQNLSQLPRAVLNCVLASLEAVYVNTCLSQAIVEFHACQEDPALAALCLRAMSLVPNINMLERNSNDQHAISIAYIKQLINNPSSLDIETSVVIAGRYWPIFEDESTLLSYMHKIAELDDSYALFIAIYSDLVKVPLCRASMLALLRNTNRSDLVSEGIGKLFAK